LIRTVIFDVQPRLGGISGTTPLRKTLIDATLQYLEALAGDAGDNPAFLRELAGSYVELARVQGDMSASNAGEPRAARDSLRKARDLVERLLSVDPTGADSLREAVLVHGQLALHELQAGQKEGAGKDARRAVELAQRVLERQPQARDARISLAEALLFLAMATDSPETYERSRAAYEALRSETPDDPALLRAVARLYRNLATPLYRKDDYASVIPLVIQAREI